MPPRFYAPQIPDAPTPLRLPDEEAHHLAHVMRLAVGSVVHVFDGRGHERRAEVVEISKHAVVVRTGEPVETVRESTLRIVVAQAVLKGDHMEDVVRDVTMMGAAAVRPVVTDHVVVPGRALASPRLAERWRRVALGSAKQCGRAVVPDVLVPCPFADVLQGDAPILMLVEPARAAAATPEGLRRACEGAAEVVLLVGPEGGWSEAEVEAATRAGACCWSLGPRTLRADRAALVAISVLDYLTADERRGGHGGAPNAG